MFMDMFTLMGQVSWDGDGNAELTLPGRYKGKWTTGHGLFAFYIKVNTNINN